MAEKGQQYQKFKDEIQRLRQERDEARADLADMLRGIDGMLNVEGIGAEELAAGLAFVGAIVNSWPGRYEVHVPTLAARAHVSNATVQVALDAFNEAGVLFTSDS